MKIGIIGSMQFTDKMLEIQKELNNLGHEAFVTDLHKEMIGKTDEEIEKIKLHQKYNLDAIREFWNVMQKTEAVLVLNLDKNGIKNYIGGNTLMEIGFAHVLNQKIYLWNPIPNISYYKTEIEAVKPIIINGDLSKISDENIEIEVRSFVSKENYNRLLEFFKKNAELVKEDFQETHYFDCPQDLRIQKNNFGSKIWMKKGKIHESAREEIEIKTNKEDFENLQKIFNNLGHCVEIKWFRDRKQFNWQGIKVCLDNTKGYGYIIELEKIGTKENKEEILWELEKKLNSLNIPLTTKEEFEKKFNDYKKNWRELTT